MATITKFEELEIRALARLKTHDFDGLVMNTSFAKDVELRQVNKYSGSVNTKPGNRQMVFIDYLQHFIGKSRKSLAIKPDNNKPRNPSKNNHKK